MVRKLTLLFIVCILSSCCYTKTLLMTGGIGGAKTKVYGEVEEGEILLEIDRHICVMKKCERK